MMRLSVICDGFDVVIVPFPFSDRQASKRRPALILSNSLFNTAGHSVMAMITTKTHSPWPGDTDIQYGSEAGLKFPCVVRLKLFTLDNRFIAKVIGKLSNADQNKFAKNYRRHIVLIKSPS